MKKSQIKRADGKFYVDTSAGPLSADEVGGLTELASKIEQNKPRPPAEFLEAWKGGIRLAGAPLFCIELDTLDSATDKEQLRPDLEAITVALGVISSNERIFVLSLYQIFSDSTVVDLCTEKGYRFPTLTDIAILDAEYRNVILRLLSSYNGW